jgi:hypothetical protein
MLEPHVGQREMLNFAPESPARTKMLNVPDTGCTLSLGKYAPKPTTLPVRFWHWMQLQTLTIIGSPSTLTLKAPHAHSAVRVM